MINVCAIEKARKWGNVQELLSDPINALVAGECCGLYICDERRPIIYHKDGGYLPHGYVAVPVVFAD